MREIEIGECFDLLEQLEEDEEFLLEELRLSILEEVIAAMNKKDVDRAELARRLNTTRAFVTRVFNTSVNLTLRTVVKMSKALGVKVSVHLHEPAVQAHWFEIYEQHERLAADRVLASTARRSGYKQVKPVRHREVPYEQSASAA